MSEGCARFVNQYSHLSTARVFPLPRFLPTNPSMFPSFNFTSFPTIVIHGSPKECFPGCENALSKLRQKWWATAVTKFTKPGKHSFGDPCMPSRWCFYAITMLRARLGSSGMESLVWSAVRGRWECAMSFCARANVGKRVHTTQCSSSLKWAYHWLCNFWMMFGAWKAAPDFL